MAQDSSAPGPEARPSLSSMLMPLLIMMLVWTFIIKPKNEPPPPPPDLVTTEITSLGKTIEVYARHHGGEYPLKLDLMVPLYLPAVPGGYTYTVEPGAFTLVNVGTHQQYISGKGLENKAP